MSGLVFAQSILYWASSPEVAAAADDLGAAAGELVQRRGSLGDEGRFAQDHRGHRRAERICEVPAAAAANSSHRSLCQGSSAA
ncbi:hypothetical protein [Actinomadura darangshiensis]|uniref:hypothetical protein n=1 Tax=Actinomadura darangshiensis TaxID=705336 RepID=UPI001FB5A384|nr:hypothetical protein [Actinomadura darangshiensis]